MKYFPLFFCLFPFCSIAQLHDNTWLMGYKGAVDPNDEFGITQFLFSSGSLQYAENNDLYSGFNDNNTVFSDSNGKVVAIFNGYWVNDRSWEKMKGGDSLRYENEPNLFGYSVSDIPQGGMFLPWPNHPDSLLLFYVSQGNAGIQSFVELASLHLQYALIRLSGNSGLGEVTIRRYVVLEDTIQYGRLSACKHANGRDWWMMINERNTNRWYQYLLDPSGINLLGQQEIGLPIIDGLSQSAYSPDGMHYAAFNAIDINNDYLDVYDFDRCVGLFSNHRQLHFSGGFAGGVAISPNSKYLYVSYTTKLYQYDLKAPDLADSEILIDVYDGYINTSATVWDFSQLAPDGKIYICSPGSTKIVHVIHSPDEAGTACQFEQHGIHLPVYNASSVTNNPYFRLGPLDGSACDTLGLDNRPIAWYRYLQDTMDLLNVSFHDLSYYEPADWSWDFGDGSPGSSDQHPQHQFDSAGVYKVCLTVSNPNASNTHCKTLYLGVSATDNPVLQSQIIVSPNPFVHFISVALSTQLRGPVFRLFDPVGRCVRQIDLSFGITEIETGALPSGLYIWEVSASGALLKSGKLIKVGY
jgi:hypothetical protein